MRNERLDACAPALPNRVSMTGLLGVAWVLAGGVALYGPSACADGMPLAAPVQPAVSAMAAAPSVAEPVLLTRSLTGKTLAQAVEGVKAAIVSNNYTFVREQAIDSRLVPSGWEARTVHVLYFCNFAKMNQALAIDVRAAQFLPCRITLIETAEGVELLVVNPAWVSASLANPLLHGDCVQLKADYLRIMEEASL